MQMCGYGSCGYEWSCKLQIWHGSADLLPGLWHICQHLAAPQVLVMRSGMHRARVTLQQLLGISRSQQCGCCNSVALHACHVQQRSFLVQWGTTHNVMRLAYVVELGLVLCCY